jgi:putative transposase
MVAEYVPLSFNGKMRYECLNEQLFDSLRLARQLIATGRAHLNHYRS